MNPAQKAVLFFSLIVFFVIASATEEKRKKIFYIIESATYRQAFHITLKDLCESYGLDMATIETEDEEKFLEAYLIANKKTGGYFINAKRKENSDSFEWNTDPPREVTFSKWLKGRPNNLHDQGEMYVMLAKEDDVYGWNDVNRYEFGNVLCMKYLESDDTNFNHPTKVRQKNYHFLRY